MAGGKGNSLVSVPAVGVVRLDNSNQGKESKYFRAVQEVKRYWAKKQSRVAREFSTQV